MKRILGILIVFVLIGLNLYAGDLAVSGKLGVGTTTEPVADIDVGGFNANGALRNVFARQYEGNSSGSGTFLGIRAWETQTTAYNGKMFSLEDTFYGSLNSAINFYRGNSVTGGYIRFATNNGTEQVTIDAWGNVGIGKTQPEEKLHIAGSARIDSPTSPHVYFFNGSTALGGVGVDLINNKINFGDWFSAAPALAMGLYTNDIERVRVDTIGNVGIGTPEPASKLHIISDEIGTGANKGFRISNYNNSQSYSLRTGIANITNTFLSVYDETAGANRLVVDTSGNVGIGTPVPVSKLHIISEEIGTGENKGFRISNYNNTQSYSLRTGITNVTNSFLSVYDETAGANRLVIDTSGNVGIGTINPANTLEVYAGSDSSQILWGENIRNAGNANLLGYGSGLKLKFSDESVPYEINKWAGIAAVAGTGWANRTDLTFYVNPSSASSPVEKMRITGEGNVGIGTTDPTFGVISNPKLGISGPTGDNARLGMKSAKSGAYTWWLYAADDAFGLGGGSDGSAGNKIQVANNGNVGIGDSTPDYKLDVTGTICQDTDGDNTCNGTVSSDIRLKTNIRNITHALDKVEQLQGVEFNYTKETLPKGNQIGFIAQHLEKVYPELIYEDMDGYKMIDYQKLTAVLTEAIKEQQQQIEELKADIALLKKTR